MTRQVTLSVTEEDAELIAVAVDGVATSRLGKADYADARECCDRIAAKVRTAIIGRETPATKLDIRVNVSPYARATPPTQVKLGTTGALAFIHVREEIERDGLTPLRAPHHTVSQIGLISELALSAGGALVLDDAEEFRRSTLHLALAVLRQMQRPPRVYVIFRSHASDARVREYIEMIERSASRDA